MKHLTAILIVLVLCGGGLLWAQQTTTAQIPAQTLPAQQIAVPIPQDPAIAKLTADLAQLRKEFDATKVTLDKVLAIQTIPADAAAVSIGSMIK